MDQAIKLFGRTIPFSETHDISTTSSCPEKSQIMDSSSDITKAEVKSLSVESVKEPEKLSTLRDNKEKDDEAHINPKAKEEQSESSTSSEQDKSFKKPDKIIPCPRCNSLDTKFCYFNNYNVNQPRHFCKNCQRYWTAGGTMRNVPIGAGRRKNKHLASQFHQIIASTTDGVLQNGFESTNSDTSTFSPQNRNGIILKFGPEAHFCDSTTTRVSSYEEPNRCPKMHSVNSSENGTKANESPQSVTRTEHVGLHGACNELRMSDPLPYCPVPPPLVFPWNNQAGNNLTSCGGASQYYQQTFVPNGSGSNQLQYYPAPPVLAVPGTCPSSIPLQFVPTGYWGSIPIWAARPGNIPLNGSFACFSPPQNNTGYSTGNGSPTLGKHCRDANFIDEEKLENCVMVPKVLRTDEPDQA